MPPGFRCDVGIVPYCFAKINVRVLRGAGFFLRRSEWMGRNLAARKAGITMICVANGASRTPRFSRMQNALAHDRNGWSQGRQRMPIGAAAQALFRLRAAEIGVGNRKGFCKFNGIGDANRVRAIRESANTQVMVAVLRFPARAREGSASRAPRAFWRSRGIEPAAAGLRTGRHGGSLKNDAGTRQRCKMRVAMQRGLCIVQS
ncbi:MAG: hypothetical protein HLUCCO15_01815 [Erythrobacteraceae bacterium HL-111]|nr:MAG: hypothetical protein HLUCCO15_01815 [Erythrobacteraceae bacterium HL-111]